MPKIRMTQTIPGAMDGIHHKKYIAGEEYEIDGVEINQRLAKIFLKANVAEVVRERKPVEMPAEEATKEAIETDEEAESEANVMRVFQLADELDKSSKEVVVAAAELGIDATSPQSGLTATEAQKIKDHFAG